MWIWLVLALALSMTDALGASPVAAQQIITRQTATGMMCLDLARRDHAADAARLPDNAARSAYQSRVSGCADYLRRFPGGKVTIPIPRRAQ